VGLVRRAECTAARMPRASAELPRATAIRAGPSPRRARRRTRGARAAMRATASGSLASRRARDGSAAASQSRPRAKPEPPSPKRGPSPPARIQRPRAVRASTMDPVPASTRSPERSPRAPRYAASTSDSTLTRRPSPWSCLIAARRSAAVQTPRAATTTCNTFARWNRRRRQSARSIAPRSRGARAFIVQRRPRSSVAITRIQVPPASTPTVHVRVM
jgi:hypothetical protein